MSSDKIIRYLAPNGTTDTDYGVVPSPIPNARRIRSRQVTLDGTPTYQRSQRTGTPRRRQGSVKVDEEWTGSIVDELSPQDHDDHFLRLLSAAAWSAKTVLNGAGSFPADFSAPSAVTATLGQQTITTTTAGAFTGLVDGQLVYFVNDETGLSGNKLNQGVFRVVSVTSATEIVVQNAAGVAESGATVKAEGVSQIIDGTIEHEMIMVTDHSYMPGDSQFGTYAGLVYTTGAINVGFGQILQATYGLQAKSEALDSVSPTFNPATPTAPPDTSSLTPTDVLGVSASGATFCLSQISINIANNIRQKRCLGTEGPKSLRSGFFDASGSFTFDYDNDSAAFYKDFRSDKPGSLMFVVRGNDGGYVFEFDRIRVTGAPGRQGGEGDADVVLNAQFDAEEGANNFIMRIGRFDRAITS